MVRFTILLTAISAAAVAGGISFRAEDIARDFGVVYAVLVEDVNGDRRPDVVAISGTQVAWFENPGWRKHVILDGVTKRDNVCIAAHDIDGDGVLDFAVGADWQPTNTAAGGSLQWIRRDPAAPGGNWKLIPLGEEPTLHRMRFGDIDGDGRRELIVVPLHGRGNKAPAWEGDGARILVYRPPREPVGEPWRAEVADKALHIVHNFIVTNMDQDAAEEIVTASREGVHVLKRARDGWWSKVKIGEGSPGEIKLGRVGRERWLATVEPWHGTSVVLYQEPAAAAKDRAGINGLWTRVNLAHPITGGHALGWGDFDGDGSDELAFGWRDKKFGVAVARREATGEWTTTLIDDGGMAAEDLTVADLNADGKPEIVAGGRSTRNVRIYWNER